MFHLAQDFILFFYNTTTLGNISYDEVIKAEKVFYKLLKSYWYQQNFLTARWWLLIFLSIAPPFIWWKFLDKKRVIEITAFGLFYGVAAIILDTIGSNAMIWSYPVRLSPYLYPQVYPYDVGCVIIPFMLVYQKWGEKFKKYFIMTGILSFLLAFVAEVIMEWLDIYHGYSWKHVYSFPVYWLLGIICWGIITKFKKLEQE
ncbi:CBO0543 family protein [Neobacillus sp. D3-1R]|uniref:CBO0543 family protein n=1 Tax=Neobacillus sp. D3-1R TaxID=3445778 RepID=UPI003FA0DC90